MKIAYLASAVTMPGSPTRRSDAYEHDRIMDALTPAFAAEGLEVEDIAWDDPAADWASYALVIIGTTWDYWDRPQQFIETLKQIEAVTLLCNPSALVKWNSRKTYLKELETKGAKLIPTLWIEKTDTQAVEAAFDHFGADRLVFKRQIGAGADGQHLLSRGAPIPDMPHPMMAQPFMRTIQSEGEFSFIFIDGAFCHALIKRAADGDYRIQSSYGGTDHAITPASADLAAAQAMMATLDDPPLYARVDMLRGEDGELLLMELELIEPFLYPLEGPNLGPMLAAAVKRRLTGA